MNTLTMETAIPYVEMRLPNGISFEVRVYYRDGYWLAEEKNYDGAEDKHRIGWSRENRVDALRDLYENLIDFADMWKMPNQQDFRHLKLYVVSRMGSIKIKLAKSIEHVEEEFGEVSIVSITKVKTLNN